MVFCFFAFFLFFYCYFALLHFSFSPSFIFVTASFSFSPVVGVSGSSSLVACPASIFSRWFLSTFLFSIVIMNILFMNVSNILPAACFISSFSVWFRCLLVHFFCSLFHSHSLSIVSSAISLSQ